MGRFWRRHIPGSEDCMKLTEERSREKRFIKAWGGEIDEHKSKESIGVHTEARKRWTSKNYEHEDTFK